jgi:hypothetical protein
VDGTGTTILVLLQDKGVPVIPLKVTVLPLGAAPKLAPVIVTDPPTGLTGPTLGDILVMLGVWPRLTADRNSTSIMICGRILARAFISVISNLLRLAFVSERVAVM